MVASNIPWAPQFPSSSGGYQVPSWTLAQSDSVSGGVIGLGFWARLNHLENAMADGTVDIPAFKKRFMRDYAALKRG